MKKNILQKLLVSALFITLLAATGWFAVNQYNTARELRDQLEAKEHIIDTLHEGSDAAQKDQEAKAAVTSERLKSAMSGLSELATQEYAYRNADMKEESETWVFGWKRPFSGNRIVIKYDGVITAGIDFKDIDVAVNQEARAVTVTVPKSKIISNEIPQESIEILEVKDGLFNKVTIDDYNDFISEQKTAMEKEAVEKGILEKADQEVRTLIENFLFALPDMAEYNLTVSTRGGSE